MVRHPGTELMQVVLKSTIKMNTWTCLCVCLM